MDYEKQCIGSGVAPDGSGVLIASAAPLSQICSNCSVALNVTDLAPLAKIICPRCKTLTRVERRYNQFSLLDILGEGGMGTVYKALDTDLNRTVALKLLKQEFGDDTEFVEMFDAEARITASINHPHVVKVFSFGKDHGQLYLAMELVDQGSLDHLIELQGRVAELQVLEIAIQVASGLAAAHYAGLIHRDVKPGNVLFGEGRVSKISDFGLAILAEREAEVHGEIWGTPYYVAPEKLYKQREDHRSDIYSLGATLFHALAGRPIFEATTATLVALKHVQARAVSLQAFAPDVSEETSYIVNRMLSKNPEERYQTYEELITHLKYARDACLTAAQRGFGRENARVVIEGREQQTFMGLITLGLLFATIVGCVLMYVFRDQFFTGSSQKQSEVSIETILQEVPRSLAKNKVQVASEQITIGIRDAKDLLLSELPAPWRSQDIGAVKVPGSSGMNGGLFIVKGSGLSIGGSADEMHFTYQVVTGDCEITARIESQTTTEEYARAGVMIRDGTSAASKFADLVVTPANRIYFQCRKQEGEAAVKVTAADSSAPYWLRVTRSGNNFSTYKSTDNVEWRQFGSTQTIEMAKTVCIGLVQCSRVESQLGVSTFSNVTVRTQ